MNKKYGWKNSIPDFRDYRIKASTVEEIQAQPQSVDLRSYVAEIYDQGELGSCTANSISAAMRMIQKKQGLLDIPPSRLFIYYNERLKEGTVKDDAGAQIRTGMKVVAGLGAVSETEWPYDVSKFTTKPADNLYKDAVQDMVHIYAGLDNTKGHDLKQCLADGYPFVFGFSVYASFESDIVVRTGVVPIPQFTEPCFGGHAVCCVGYDDTRKTFTVLNSWGKDWGDHGYFHIPYAYITNPYLADDFWTLRSMEEQNDPKRKWIVPNA